MPDLPIDVLISGRTPEVWGRSPSETVTLPAGSTSWNGCMPGSPRPGKSGKAVVPHALHGLGALTRPRLPSNMLVVTVVNMSSSGRFRPTSRSCFALR